MPKRLELLGAPLDLLSIEEAVAYVDGLVERGARGQQASLNAAKVVRIRHDPKFAEALRGCDLVLADGQSIVWAAKALGLEVPERVAGIDLMAALLDRAAERGYRVFLLGAHADVIEDAAAEIQRRHPGINIVGAQDGYYPPDEEASIVSAIEAAEPDLLFVAFDTPRKELFLARVRQAARVPFAMGVGGSFDVLAGRRKRAPAWMQRAGVEWLFRLLQEPRRLAGRYLVGNTVFIALVVRELVQTRRRLKARARVD